MINRNLVRSNPHKSLKPLYGGFLPDLLPHSAPLHPLRADFLLQARQTLAKNGRQSRQFAGRESKDRLLHETGNVVALVGAQGRAWLDSGALGRRLMRVISEILALEPDREIASTVFRRRAAAVFPYKTLDRGPGFDHRAGKNVVSWPR